VVVALVGNVGLGVGAWEAWRAAEVSLGLSVLGSSKEESVRTYYNILIRIGARFTSGCKEHELIKSEALSTCFNDSGSCGFGESEGSHCHLGDVEESDVVSHGANNHGDSLSTGGQRARLTSCRRGA